MEKSNELNGNMKNKQDQFEDLTTKNNQVITTKSVSTEFTSQQATTMSTIVNPTTKKQEIPIDHNGAEAYVIKPTEKSFTKTKDYL